MNKKGMLKDIKKGEAISQQLQQKRDKAALKDAKEEYGRLLQAYDTAEKKVELLLGLNQKRSRTHHIQRTKDLRSSEATSVMVISDIHLEERVESSTTNGLNEYNLDISRESVMRFFKNGLRLHDIFRKDIKINNILLSILGDVINGYIHEEYLINNFLSPTQAIMTGQDLLVSGINYLLENSDAKLTVVCKVGNHGRTTARLYISTEYKNSFEWMMYHHLAKQFAGNDRVQFIIENGYLTYVTLYDKFTIRFHHGHAIRFQGGVGGITIPVNKAIAQWDKERQASLDVFGHHHTQMMDAGKFVANGSILGYNPFGIYIHAAYERPQQAFFLVDAERGKTICAPILVR